MSSADIIKKKQHFHMVCLRVTVTEIIVKFECPDYGRLAVKFPEDSVRDLYRIR